VKAVVDTNVIAYFLLGTPKFVTEREGVAMATFDEKVLKAYPEIARRPRDLP